MSDFTWKEKLKANRGALIGTGIGTLGGGFIGYQFGKNTEGVDKRTKQDSTGKARWAGMISGALSGGTLGFIGGHALHDRVRMARDIDGHYNAAHDEFNKRKERHERYQAWDEERTRTGPNGYSPPAPTSSLSPSDYSHLGLDPKGNHSYEDLKKAAKNLAIKHHPDRGGDPDKAKAANDILDKVRGMKKSASLLKISSYFESKHNHEVKKPFLVSSLIGGGLGAAVGGGLGYYAAGKNKRDGESKEELRKRRLKAALYGAGVGALGGAVSTMQIGAQGIMESDDHYRGIQHDSLGARSASDISEIFHAAKKSGKKINMNDFSDYHRKYEPWVVGAARDFNKRHNLK